MLRAQDAYNTVNPAELLRCLNEACDEQSSLAFDLIVLPSQGFRPAARPDTLLQFDGLFDSQILFEHNRIGRRSCIQQ